MPLPKILNLPMPMEEQMKTISALMKPFLFDQLRFNWRKIKKRECEVSRWWGKAYNKECHSYCKDLK